MEIASDESFNYIQLIQGSFSQHLYDDAHRLVLLCHNVTSD